MRLANLFKRRGFTLIEMMVVIAIIGLLSAVILASLSVAQQKGRDARRLSDIKQIQLALELYYDANTQYPAAISGNNLAPGFMPVLPSDPGNFAYAYTALVGYATNGTCGSYHLGASMEQTSNTGLSQDFDGTVGGAYGTGTGDGATCGGGTDFNGLATTGAGASCSGSAGVNGSTETCYDVRP